ITLGTELNPETILLATQPPLKPTPFPTPPIRDTTLLGAVTALRDSFFTVNLETAFPNTAANLEKMLLGVKAILGIEILEKTELFPPEKFRETPPLKEESN
ncbi:MAG: hypothetical protein B6D56_07415, partial [Candidatus Omnitrophica bacterium 4484_70.1]